ncbi:hypothetical protein [Desulfotignum phosphitoxidans]|uniref:Uncharacterized protein n=1 Tax=Desulfotignum phosphitoxidans DSM 13687 TaxID=1286635 RepID=S0G1F2_9BACT|nr:hypothetical protein [Desulfotignum phosphitoxidans]EMS77541.1 hypothetical protein Dpo_14c00240 [Desulfotignum phosphitoxidans DSM 13687]
MDINDLKNDLKELNETNKETKDFLEKIDKKIEELDSKYAKTMDFAKKHWQRKMERER